MQPISVVIIAKNESHILGKTLGSVQQLTDDIVVADTGSTDNTMAIARQFGCQVHEIDWQGYGKTKNRALEFARYNWVLFLDADEALDTTALQHLQQLQPASDTVYKLRYQNFIGNKRVRYGEWKSFSKIRLFNKQYVSWDDSDIHEKLILPDNCRQQTLDGYILHYSISNLKDYADKMSSYAELVAQKYHQKGKQAGFFGLYVYPSYEFIRNYFFHLAIMDGWLGFVSSYFSAYYVFLKYHRLKELNLRKKNTTV